MDVTGDVVDDQPIRVPATRGRPVITVRFVSGNARPSIEELTAALAADPESLLVQLGSFGGDVSPRDALQKGARIFEALLQTLRESICTDLRMRQVVEDGSDPLTMAGVIADTILGATGHVQPATLAALIVKHGVPRYCSAYWP